jgi:hypothetical protein
MLSAALRSLSLLSLAAVAACNYTTHEGVLANGERSQLYFNGVASTSSNALAVGYAAPVTVQRYSGGDASCHGLGLRDHTVTTAAGDGTRVGDGSGDVRIQGGSIDTEHCASLPSDAVTLVSAACTDDTCAATEVATGDPRVVTLAVTGTHAGTSHLTVTLKRNDDGVTYQDSIEVRFAAPARIRLAADARELAAMTGPVLPGVAITKPTAVVVDASGEVLEIADDALAATTEGTSFVETTDYPPLHAQAPGHTVLRWKYPGVPDRTIDLEVVAPSEAHALFVYAPLEAATAGTSANAYVDPADAPPAAEPASGRITSIDLVENDFGTYPVRVKLADGRFAVCTLEDPVVTPAALASTLTGLDLSTFDLEAKTVGAGTVTLHLANSALATTLAVNVTARPSR